MRDLDQQWWQDPQFRCEVCDQPILDNDAGRCGTCIDGGRDTRALHRG